MFMFDHIFIKSSYYREKHIQAPLLEERINYLQYWSERAKSQHSLRSIAQYLLRIVEFLHLETPGIITLDQIEKAATDWAKYQYNHPQKRASFSKTGENRFIWFAKDWLKRINRLDFLPEERISLFNKIFEKRKALLRHIEVPLLKERLKYLQYWRQENKNVQQLLPVLSVYLGHKYLAHTSVYLTMTDNLLEEANMRFEKYVKAE